ncbi:MAG: hypothetical protein IJQ32_05225 [Paludibacteraceae bacterium]|nr:hypothetical protein [Paludibacteraceae bacterium]
MRKMYKKPETEAIAVEMMTTLCNSQTVTISTEAANPSNPSLAPKRPF